MPTVAEVAAAHRASLAAGEAESFGRMIDAYGRAWQNISLELGRITGAIDAATAAGEPVSPAWLHQQDRLTNLRAAVRTEVGRFAAVANNETQLAQAAAILTAPAHVVEIAEAAGAVGDFAAVSTEALDALVGHLADGSPLRRLFAALPGDGAQRAEEALIRGVSRGLSPRALVRDVRHVLGGNLARALTIARTETNRAYRSASQLTMEANADVLDGWRWTCARQLRTCAMCWAMDGTVHPVTATLDSHPNAVLVGTFLPYDGLLEFVAARYDGPAVVITTANGDRLTIGPNHPVFTARGLVRAKRLRPGDQVIYDPRGKPSGMVASLPSDLIEVPTLEDAFDTCRLAFSGSNIAGSAHDFHGDRVFIEGEIEVVRPNGDLLPVADGHGIEQMRKPDFVRADAELLRLAGLCPRGHPFGRVGVATSGSMSSQPSLRPLGAVRAGIASGGTLVASAPAIDAGSPYGLVRVVHVAVERYRGWAYDATTEAGAYAVDGFVVSNCRCAMVPIVTGGVTRHPAPAAREFARLSPTEQDAVLGKAKGEAYRSGAITLDDLVGRTTSSAFGPGLAERSLKDALG